MDTNDAKGLIWLNYTVVKMKKKVSTNLAR